MSHGPSAQIREHFASLTDPRRRKVTCPLLNIAAIALCAVTAGADDFVTIAAWGRQRRAWLAQSLDLTNGIPSHDRFNAVFEAIKPDEFERCLPGWITAPHEITAGQVIAIDGKTLRRSFDEATAESALPMVSARATANHISLGQVVVAETSDEITAIPKLLEHLGIAGALVTVDAMGCQTEVDEKIIAQKADYVLAVKGNQPTRHAGVVESFLGHMDDDFARVKVSRHETVERGHGRSEHRTYSVCDVPEDLPDRTRGKGPKQIGMAIGDTVRGGKPCDEVRYSILSKRLSARRFGAAVRGHRGIENSLHWQLDMSLGEDRSRVRKGHADANLALVRRTALSPLKNETSQGIGVQTKRLTAGWNDGHPEQVLFRT